MVHWAPVADPRTIENFFFRILIDLASLDAEFDADSEFEVKIQNK